MVKFMEEFFEVDGCCICSFGSSETQQDADGHPVASVNTSTTFSGALKCSRLFSCILCPSLTISLCDPFSTACLSIK